MERARDGDLERLEPVRETGRFASAEAALRKGPRGRSTRTGRVIWTWWRGGALTLAEGWRNQIEGAALATRRDPSHLVTSLTCHTCLIN